jgi:multidrug efflux pump subunit AcrA (membrane-fusion protein)
LVGGCDQPVSDPRTADTLVRIVSVEPASPEERAFTETVAARVQSDLGFRVSGKIVERLVDTGQLIQAGTPLYQIDPTDYEAATGLPSALCEALARVGC